MPKLNGYDASPHSAARGRKGAGHHRPDRLGAERRSRADSSRRIRSSHCQAGRSGRIDGNASRLAKDPVVEICRDRGQAVGCSSSDNRLFTLGDCKMRNISCVALSAILLAGCGQGKPAPNPPPLAPPAQVDVGGPARRGARQRSGRRHQGGRRRQRRPCQNARHQGRCAVRRITTHVDPSVAGNLGTRQCAPLQARALIVRGTASTGRSRLSGAVVC